MSWSRWVACWLFLWHCILWAWGSLQVMVDKMLSSRLTDEVARNLEKGCHLLTFESRVALFPTRSNLSLYGWIVPTTGNYNYCSELWVMAHSDSPDEVISVDWMCKYFCLVLRLKLNVPESKQIATVLTVSVAVTEFNWELLWFWRKLSCCAVCLYWHFVICILSIVFVK